MLTRHLRFVQAMRAEKITVPFAAVRISNIGNRRDLVLTKRRKCHLPASIVKKTVGRRRKISSYSGNREAERGKLR